MSRTLRLYGWPWLKGEEPAFHQARRKAVGYLLAAQLVPEAAARLALLARAAFGSYAEGMVTQGTPVPAAAKAPGRSSSTVL